MVKSYDNSTGYSANLLPDDPLFDIDDNDPCIPDPSVGVCDLDEDGQINEQCVQSGQRSDSAHCEHYSDSDQQKTCRFQPDHTCFERHRILQI